MDQNELLPNIENNLNRANQVISDGIQAKNDLAGLNKNHQFHNALLDQIK